jgi:hypothetical protein
VHGELDETWEGGRDRGYNGLMERILTAIGWTVQRFIHIVNTYNRKECIH